MEMMSTHQLTVTIAGKCVCRDLAWTLRQGEIWAVLGQNGVGKTTLLRTLAGLHTPDAGYIQILERKRADWPRRELARVLGVLFQLHEDPFPSTVLETALVGRHPHLGRWQWENEDDIERALGALAQMDMTELVSREITSLSGGERQRLALATLLTQDPAVMLLDEPTSHLDLRHQVYVLRRLQELARSQDKALCMVLHDVNMAARYCDQALLLFGEGNSLAGPVREVLTAENLERLYGHPIDRLDTPQGAVYLPRAV